LLEEPEEVTMSPPAPLVPVPIVTYIDPARPDVEAPEPIYKAPLLPRIVFFHTLL
jgi:hypothetical protein